MPDLAAAVGGPANKKQRGYVVAAKAQARVAFIESPYPRRPEKFFGHHDNAHVALFLYCKHTSSYRIK
jgi:hypothetical protein